MKPEIVISKKKWFEGEIDRPRKFVCPDCGEGLISIRKISFCPLCGKELREEGHNDGGQHSVQHGLS